VIRKDFRTKRRPPPLAPQQKVLADWRGIDLTAQESTHQRAAKSAGDILPRVLADLRLDQRRSSVEILKAWNQLLDPNLVAHAQPTNLRNGTLFVTVDNSAWLSEIVRYRRKEILERLQLCFGKNLIARLSFRAG